MGVVTGWVVLSVVTALVSLLSAAYLYSRYVFNYFKSRRIPYERPTFPFGSLAPVVTLRKPYHEFLSQMYEKHKGKKFVGFFQFFQKTVLIIDRELAKNVIVTDFEYFNAKNIHHNREVEPLSAHLFALDGTEWKFLRTKMRPVFSSAKLKAMYQTIADVTLKLDDHFKKISADTDVIEFRKVFMRYSIEMISSTAFGIESDVFKNDSSPFLRACKDIMSTSISSMFRNSLMFYGKGFAKAFNLRIIPRHTHDFVMQLIKDIVQYREISKKERKDFIQVMMEIKQDVKNDNTDNGITLNELAAQAYIFILAGYESVSNTMSFFMYEMAMNPEVQDRVFAEISKPEAINYDTLGSMEYLDMALDETLRKHMPLGFLGRVCSKDYKVPGTNYVIEKGTHIMVPSHGLHWDPDLFPDPERFIPERFSKENKPDMKPFSYMPFGEGPRICIGMKFGRLVIKAGLATLLRKFRVDRTETTPTHLEYEVCTFTTCAKGGIYLKLVPRTTELAK